MSEINKINGELTRLSEALEAAANEFEAASLDYATKRSDYEIAKARAVLRSEQKTASAREHEATIAVETTMRESRTSEAIMNALKERIRSLQSILTATQTKGAILKEEMRLSGRDY